MNQIEKSVETPVYFMKLVSFGANLQRNYYQHYKNITQCYRGQVARLGFPKFGEGVHSLAAPRPGGVPSLPPQCEVSTLWALEWGSCPFDPMQSVGPGTTTYGRVPVLSKRLGWRVRERDKRWVDVGRDIRGHSGSFENRTGQAGRVSCDRNTGTSEIQVVR